MILHNRTKDRHYSSNLGTITPVFLSKQFLTLVVAMEYSDTVQAAEGDGLCHFASSVVESFAR